MKEVGDCISIGIKEVVDIIEVRNGMNKFGDEFLNSCPPYVFVLCSLLRIEVVSKFSYNAPPFRSNQPDRVNDNIADRITRYAFQRLNHMI